MKQYSDISYIFSVLAGQGISVSIWADPFLRHLRPKNGGAGFNKFLQKFCEPIVPLIPLRNVSPPLALNTEHGFASGKFWSKGIGFPIELLICRADKAVEVLKQKNNPVWQNAPLIEYEDYGLKGYTFSLPDDITRSEFTENARR